MRRRSTRQKLIEAIEPRLLLSTIYVDANSPGALQDGAGWSSAHLDLQQALAASIAGDEIHVADGTYKPTGQNDRTQSFQLKDGVVVLGGFAGYGAPDPELRNPGQYSTVLSGNIGSTSSTADNSYHVVVGSGVGAATILDGFTISGGNANGTSANANGGGFYSSAGNATISNCIFTANLGNFGGGVYNAASSATTIRDCSFSANSVLGFGGAMYNASSSPTVTGCSFTRNTGRNNAGAVYNTASSPIFLECRFEGNTTTSSSGSGGAIYNTTSSSPQLVNCILAGNSVGGSGGAIYNNSSCAPVIINCTISFNRAGSFGGAMVVSTSATQLRNSIIWGNSDNNGAPNFASYPPTTTYCDVQGGWAGAGNINADPLFARNPSPGADAVWGTTDDDYGDLRPQACSLVVDAGSSPSVPSGTVTDISGGDRFVDVPGIADTGVGSVPIVDMGAYEAISALSATAGGPYVVLEESAISLHARGVTDAEGSLQFEWEWSGDAQFDDASGTSPVFTSVGRAPGMYAVSLRVTDQDQKILIVQAQVRVMPRIAYVDLRAGANGNGASWSSAFNSLAFAVEQSISGMTLRVAAGTYKPTTSLNRAATFSLKNGVALHGGYAGIGSANPNARNPATNVTVLSGDLGAANSVTDNSFHVVTASGVDGTAILDGVTIRAGYVDGKGAALYISAGAPTVSRCVFTGNVSGDGGAVAIIAGASPKFADCTFSGNSAAYPSGGNGNGGAVYCIDSTVSFERCTFTGNYGSGAGGALCARATTLSMVDCSFYRNSGGDGGAVSVDASQALDVVLRNSLFAGNSAHGWGGAASSIGPARFEDCRFEGNTSDLWGGAMIAFAEGPTLTGCTFVNNSSADHGGAIFIVVETTATLTNCAFSQNRAGEDGGAVYVQEYCPTEIQDCSFTSNVAAGNGGGVAVAFEGASVTRCTFTRNVATLGGGMYGDLEGLALPSLSSTFAGNIARVAGGGIYLGYADPVSTLANSMFVGNSAPQGGGLFVQSPLTILNCTFAANSAASGGGVYSDSGYPLTFQNCILWLNSASSGAQFYKPAGGMNIYHSDVQDGVVSPVYGNIKVDPKFIRNPAAGADAQWGTPDDDYGNLALGAASPCVDAGDSTAIPASVTLDRAGNPRSIDVPGVRDPGVIVDMGAFERTPPVAVSSSAWQFDQVVPTLTITFDGDINPLSLTSGDLRLTNLTTSQTVDCSANSTVSYNAATRTATWSFAAPLPDGNYRATLEAGSITDQSGAVLVGSLTLDFFILAGDANRDRMVDIRDLAILASNWQGAGKLFSQGDFNYDGKVDAADLAILSARWQQSMVPPAAPQPAAISRTPVRSAARMISSLE